MSMLKTRQAVPPLEVTTLDEAVEAAPGAALHATPPAQ
jgi:hypothetical protein